VESLSTVSWSYLVNLPVDDAVGYFFCEVLYRLFDEPVALSSMKNSYTSPWLTRQLAYLKKNKTRLFKRFKISGLQTVFTKYSSAMAEFVQYKSDCYKNYLSRCKRDFKTNPKLFFFRRFLTEI